MNGITLKIGGRADFIHEVNNGYWIIDGKASEHKGKYVDPEQLIWYAVQFYLKYKKSPTRLGFLYYRFSEDPIQWIEYDANSMVTNVKMTFDVAKKIKLKMFDAKVGSQCSMCEYRQVCDDGKEHHELKKIASGGYVEQSIFSFD